MEVNIEGLFFNSDHYESKYTDIYIKRIIMEVNINGIIMKVNIQIFVLTGWSIM